MTEQSEKNNMSNTKRLIKIFLQVPAYKIIK